MYIYSVQYTKPMVAMAVRLLNLSTWVRFQFMSLNGSQLPNSRNVSPTSHLSLTKPSWVIRTESNVHREKRIKPDPPCVVCAGSGRIECSDCRGRGRTNCTHLEMLPKGEWPKWCKACKGSGLSCCTRCLGTGEFRYAMGFRFMTRDSSHNQNQENGVQSDIERRSTVADLYDQ